MQDHITAMTELIERNLLLDPHFYDTPLPKKVVEITRLPENEFSDFLTAEEYAASVGGVVTVYDSKYVVIIPFDYRRYIGSSRFHL